MEGTIQLQSERGRFVCCVLTCLRGWFIHFLKNICLATRKKALYQWLGRKWPLKPG